MRNESQLSRGRGTYHHFDFLHNRALLNHKPSSLNAGFPVPQPPRLAISNGTVRTSILSDVEFGRAICRCRGRNGLSRCMYADRDLRFFEIRQPVVEHGQPTPLKRDVCDCTPSSSTISTNLDSMYEPGMCPFSCGSLDGDNRSCFVQPLKDLPFCHGDHV